MCVFFERGNSAREEEEGRFGGFKDGMGRRVVVMIQAPRGTSAACGAREKPELSRRIAAALGPRLCVSSAFCFFCGAAAKKTTALAGRGRGGGGGQT